MIYDLVQFFSVSLLVQKSMTVQRLSQTTDTSWIFTFIIDRTLSHSWAIIAPHRSNHSITLVPLVTPWTSTTISCLKCHHLGNGPHEDTSTVSSFRSFTTPCRCRLVYCPYTSTDLFGWCWPWTVRHIDVATILVGIFRKVPQLDLQVQKGKILLLLMMALVSLLPKQMFLHCSVL
jgi:hypothetical protein